MYAWPATSRKPIGTARGARPAFLPTRGGRRERAVSVRSTAPAAPTATGVVKGRAVSKVTNTASQTTKAAATIVRTTTLKARVSSGTAARRLQRHAGTTDSTNVESQATVPQSMVVDMFAHHGPSRSPGLTQSRPRGPTSTIRRAPSRRSHSTSCASAIPPASAMPASAPPSSAASTC